MASTGKMLLVVDVDTGIDDAHALMLALTWSDAEVLAVTCVNGNVGLEAVCDNTLRVLQVCGKAEVPVYPGCSCPLLDEGIQASHYHGKDGLGDVEWPDKMDRSLLQKEHASVALVRLANQHPGEITLVALAPLTNVAVAMRLDPDFTKKLKNLYIMGGNIEGRGNCSPAKEFNFAVDPDAAFVVLNGSHCPTYILPWEPCIIHLLDWDFYEKWTSQDSDKSRFKQKITNKIKEIQKNRNSPGFRSCDLMAMGAVLVPECVVETQAVYAAVEIQGQLTRGQMVVDWVGHLQKPANVNLITKLNLSVLEDHLLAAVK